MWTLSKKGKFTPKSLYWELGGFTLTTFPLKGIWTSCIPSKVAFFMWIVYLDKALTLDHLQSRCWNLANRCILCLKEELVDHIFLHCDMAFGVCSFFLSHLGISWSFPPSFSDLIRGWSIHKLEGLPTIIWFYLPGAVCWGLWKERNSRIFEDRARDLEEILLYIHRALLEWVAICPDFEVLAWEAFWQEEL